MNDLIANQTFTNQDFSNQKLAGKEYDNCTFANCSFIQADIAVVVFLECTFMDCDFTKVMMKQTAFRDACSFKDCKLLGANFSSCDNFMFSAEFRGCIMDYVSFYGFEIKNTQFTDCKLVGADFTQAIITGSLFRDCDLANTIFDQTIAEKVDFSTAFNFDIDPTQNRLKKAKFSTKGLPGLLKKYDLEIT
ncbi:pentapeptide repeat-containing protein [Aquimarina sp. 2201CG14-23]|uniref:pentapeptide repeat-containing protein n=1 Tax=Aquimarina mycalae TaxID=3040073 RepID=UPI002477DB2A|nr:pentapeptide repeat-containing protein [Aquimarina sp. 2201CG14-23]MDH7445744.1 pentapeptide repeat-containing protein [Aquimarina sp. 2201CG14-23]